MICLLANVRLWLQQHESKPSFPLKCSRKSNYASLTDAVNSPSKERQTHASYSFLECHRVCSSVAYVHLFCSGASTDKLQQLLGNDIAFLRQLDDLAAAGTAQATGCAQPSSSSAGPAEATATKHAAMSKGKVKQESDADEQDMGEHSTVPAAQKGSGSKSKSKLQPPQQQQQQQQRAKQRNRAGAARKQLADDGEQKQVDGQHEQEADQLDDPAVKREEVQHENDLQQRASNSAAGAVELTLQLFKAYADWAKQVHFSCQTCNAELQSVMKELQGTEGPPAKRQKVDSKLKPGKQQQWQPSETPEPSECGEDETEDASEAADDVKADAPSGTLKQKSAAAAAMLPERQSSRLQQKSAQKAGSRSSATPKAKAATAKPKARAGGGQSVTKRSAGGSSTVSGPAAQPIVSLEQVEAEFWRLVEQPVPGRLVESWSACVTPEQAAAQSAELPCSVGSIARSRANMLRAAAANQPVRSLLMPQLYVGSCFSMQCWQMTQHSLHGVHFLQSGSHKV